MAGKGNELLVAGLVTARLAELPARATQARKGILASPHVVPGAGAPSITCVPVPGAASCLVVPPANTAPAKAAAAAKYKYKWWPNTMRNAGVSRAVCEHCGVG